ncbi:MAG: Ig-like domain-containing protein, partial [Gemmatimonadota bacterium]|nr:Ig-like domain-containing protein [Gemmatimonadota bacterium]
MAKLRLHRLFALLLLTACAGQSTVVVVDVANVVVAPDPASVEVGLTLQLQASAFDASGTQIMGQAVTWESTVTGVATISASGVATGMSVGSTVIRATIGGVTGSRTLTVDPTACVTRTDVTLSPGSYMSFPGNECLLLPAGAPGDLYRVAIARPTLIADSLNTPMVTLDLAPVLTPAATSEQPAPVAAPPPVQRREEGPKIDGRQALEHLRRMDVTRRFHNELRMRERDLGLDPSLRLPNLAQVGGPPARGHLPAPPATRDLYLGLTCSTSTTSPVQLIGFDDNLAIYQETAEFNTDPISSADATELLTYFDSYVKDMVVAYWGPVPDTDGNGRMVITTTPSLDGAAAAVFSGDFLQTAGCPSSNQGEVIYFDGDL